MYKNEQEPQNFIMSRHGNAQKLTAAIYHRTYATVLKKGMFIN